jgi:hypothetical protein
MRSGAIRQIVAVNRGDYRVGQVELTHRFSDMPRFFRVERSRFSFADRTEAAVARANVAAEHEGSRAIRPAFENIGTACFLADSVQVQSLNQLQNVVLIGRIAQSNL